MRVYVAGSSEELERVEAFERLLVEHGFEVVSTWRQDVEERGCGNPPDASNGERRAWTLRNLGHIGQAHALVVLVSDTHPARGAFWELGYAEANCLVTVCVGPTKVSITCGYADYECEQDSEAIAFLCGVRKETE